MTLQQTFDFAPRKPADTEARRNLVIEAGAGTGKTTAIVAEVLKLMLEREGLAPERIVLMTFTEKAAGEIADRIRTALEELGGLLSVVGSQLSGSLVSGVGYQVSGTHGLPDSSRKAETPRHPTPDTRHQLPPEPETPRQPTTDNREQTVGWPINSPNPLITITDPERAQKSIAHHLANIDLLRSQTIHSFCQSLLRGFPIEAGLDPQFKIIEGFERALLHSQVYDAWLDQETRVQARPEHVEEWELLFAHAGYLFQIRDLILTLVERRDLLQETEYDFGTFEEVREPLLDAVHAIRRCPDDVGDEHARRIFAYLRETTPALDTLEECIAYLQPIAASILQANLPRHGILKEALKILRAGDKGRSFYDRLVSHRAAMAVLALTRRFLAFLDAEKRILGVVDFDDLLLRTLAVLDDEAVLARARNQFDFIFVDEFQDTDRTQARIIEKLARDAGGGYVPGKTIVVGDPKQSIYGFRRADPETYYRMTEELHRGGAERRVIGDQYRSDPPLLDVINAMFSRLFPEQPVHDPNVFRPAYNTLTPRAKTRREMDARVTMLHAQHEDKSDRYFAEGEAIAEWIQSNRDRDGDDLRRFAILFRRLTKIDDYLDTLDRYGIDYVLPPTRMFLDRRAPVDLLAVLRAIAYPFDRGAQISAARTPYFALTDVEIAQGRAEGEGLRAEGGSANDADRESGGAPQPSALSPSPWATFTASLARFAEASAHCTVAQLIDLVVTTCGIERVYDAAADGVRHLRHLEHVRAIAFEYDQRQGGSVRQFVDEIARRRAEPEEMEPSLADESQNAVRILSVHAAKGLEFDTVILPDLSFPTISSDALQLFTVEEPRSLVISGRADSISANFRYAGEEKLKKISGRREEAEMRRLFYVAVTRAKTDVVFVCNLHEETKNIGFLKTLTEVLAMDKAMLASLWPDEGRSLQMTPIGPVAFEKMQVHEAAGRTRKRLHDPALEAELLAADIVPPSIATPEPITTLTTADVAARRAGSRNRSAGILLHRILELWDGRADTEPMLRQLAVEAAADAETQARVRRRLSTIARSPMLQRIARAETVGREVPIHFVEHGTVVERRIDRVIREDGHDLVIDYKSGTPDDTRLDRDRDQVERYCRALTAITGRECAGVLWYVDLEREVVVEVGGRG